MKLTPLDIHHKEFRHSLRGYAEEEVDQFLDEVADELERLFKENIDLSERLEAAAQQVRDFQLKESAVNSAIIAAQSAGEEMKGKARTEADAVVHDAEIRAKEIIHNALAKKQQIAAELIRIKQAEEEFRGKFKTLLEQHQRAISEVALPDDVTVLLGDTDEGVVGEVEVRASSAFAPAATAPSPAVSPPPAPQRPAATVRTAAVAQAAAAPEPPAAGFVQAVALGEVAAPELPPDVELMNPREFTMPGFEAFGEREDDGDIEEID
jgi:cell division initiation protein